MKYRVCKKRAVMRWLVWIWVGALPLIVYMGLIGKGLLVCVGQIKAQEDAICAAQMALTDVRITRKYADYEQNCFYVYYNLSYHVDYPIGKDKDYVDEKRLRVTSNQFDEIRVGDKVGVNGQTLIQDNEYDEIELRKD